MPIQSIGTFTEYSTIVNVDSTEFINTVQNSDETYNLQTNYNTDLNFNSTLLDTHEVTSNVTYDVNLGVTNTAGANTYKTFDIFYEEQVDIQSSTTVSFSMDWLDGDAQARCHLWTTDAGSDWSYQAYDVSDSGTTSTGGPNDNGDGTWDIYSNWVENTNAGQVSVSIEESDTGSDIGAEIEIRYPVESVITTS